VYFPDVMKQKHIHIKLLLFISTLYFIMTLGALGFFSIFWLSILELFKPWFWWQLPILYSIIIFCGLLSLLNFLVKVLIGFHKYLINKILWILTLIWVLILSFYSPESPHQMIHFFSLFLSLCILISYFLLVFI
jgi:hypothetical protein